LVNQELHPVEKRVVSLLENGEAISVERIGGFQSIKEGVSSLANSPVLPEIVQALAVVEDHSHDGIILSLVASCTNGIALRGCVNAIDPHISDTLQPLLFRVYIDQINTESLGPVGRSGVLDGALRIALREPSLRYAFIAALLDMDWSSSTAPSRWYAKIVGVANTYWYDDSLLRRLYELSGHSEAADEASFEIGIAHMVKFLRCIDCKEAIENIVEARGWFRKSMTFGNSRPDAKLFEVCLQTLLDFYECKLDDPNNTLADEIRRRTLELKLYHRSTCDPPWLGARSLEVVQWTQLAENLQRLDDGLVSPAWYEPASMIELHLLPIFQASRAILRMDEEGAIERLVQPKIVSCIAEQPAFATLLRTWLQRNASSELSEIANELLRKVDSSTPTQVTRRVLCSSSRREMIVNVVSELIPQTDRGERLARVMQSAFGVFLESLTEAQLAVIDEQISAMESHPDYERSPVVQRLCNTMVLWLTSFISSRLEMTVGHEPSVAYLFKAADGKKAHESELQADLINQLRPFLLGTEIEVSDIGGGRADVFVPLRAEHLVIEVKREEVDCSFGSLERSYSSQTCEYQNTTARIGFLLVLDQTDRGGTSIHLRDLFKTLDVQRIGESETRRILIVKMPGERLRPSDQTKKAKADRVSKKRGGQGTA
jgi:hypothetical protein